MIIRDATQNDIQSLAKLAQETYSDTFGHTMSSDELENALKSRSEEYFNSILHNETILVAEHNNSLLGFIQFGYVTYDSIQTTDKDIELNKIYI